MKATARVIRGSVRAVATATGNIGAMAYALPTGIMATAAATDQTGKPLVFLNVTPEAPQQLVWLVPQYGVDYTVNASSGLEWLIR